MNQRLKDYYADLLWIKVVEKFKDFAKGKIQGFNLPMENFDSKVTMPLFSHFYKTVTGNDFEPPEDTTEIMKKNSFDRQLQESFKGSMKTQTLNMYAKFIGFDSFQKFANAYPTSLFLIGIFYVLNRPQTETRLLSFDEEKRVYEFLEQALNAEFKTYQQSPKIDTTELNNFYDVKVEDYWNTIFRVLTMHHEKKMSIINEGNESVYKIEDKKIVLANDSLIVIKTKEAWDLFWHLPKESKYDSAQIRMNTFYNTYTFQKMDSTFKIVAYKTDSFIRRYDWQKYVK